MVLKTGGGWGEATVTGDVSKTRQAVVDTQLIPVGSCSSKCLTSVGGNLRGDVLSCQCLDACAAVGVVRRQVPGYGDAPVEQISGVSLSVCDSGTCLPWNVYEMCKVDSGAVLLIEIYVLFKSGFKNSKANSNNNNNNNCELSRR